MRPANSAVVDRAYDAVDKAVFQDSLRYLKVFWQFGIAAEELLDDRLSCKSYARTGFAMIKSPSMAKLAVTPPYVGSVRMAT